MTPRCRVFLVRTISILTLLLGVLKPTAMAEARLKLGILSGPKSANEVAILAAQLGSEEAFTILERADLAPLLQERRLALDGLRDRPGSRLLGADALVVVEKVEVEGRTALSTRLLSVRAGAVIEHLVVPMSVEPNTWSRGVQAAILRHQTGLKRAGDVPVVLIKIFRPSAKVGFGAWGNLRRQRDAARFTDLFALALSGSRAVLVLEQERLAEVGFDLGLVEMEVAPFKISAEVEGIVHFGDPVSSVKLGIRQAGQDDVEWTEAIEVPAEDLFGKGPGKTVAAFANVFVTKVADQDPLFPMASTEAADALHQEAKWFYTMGRDRQARRRWASSRSLGHTSLESDFLGIILANRGWNSKHETWNFGRIEEFFPDMSPGRKLPYERGEFPSTAQVEFLVDAAQQTLELQRKPGALAKLPNSERFLERHVFDVTTPFFLSLFDEHDAIPEGLKPSIFELRKLLPAIYEGAGRGRQYLNLAGVPVRLWSGNSEEEITGQALVLDRTTEEWIELSNSENPKRATAPKCIQVGLANFRRQLVHKSYRDQYGPDRIGHQHEPFYDWRAGRSGFPALAEALREHWGGSPSVRQELDITLLLLAGTSQDDPAAYGKGLEEYIDLLEEGRDELAADQSLLAYALAGFSQHGSLAFVNPYFDRLESIHSWAAEHLEHPVPVANRTMRSYAKWYPKPVEQWVDSYEKIIRRRSEQGSLPEGFPLGVALGESPTNRKAVGETSSREAEPKPTEAMPDSEIADEGRPVVNFRAIDFGETRVAFEDGDLVTTDHLLLAAEGDRLVLARNRGNRTVHHVSPTESSLLLIDLSEQKPIDGKPFQPAWTSLEPMPDWMAGALNWQVYYGQKISLDDSGVVVTAGPYRVAYRLDSKSWKVQPQPLPWAAGSKWSLGIGRTLHDGTGGQEEDGKRAWVGIVNGKQEHSVLRIHPETLEGTVLASTQRRPALHQVDRSVPPEKILGAFALPGGEVFSLTVKGRRPELWRFSADGTVARKMVLPQEIVEGFSGFRVTPHGWALLTSHDRAGQLSCLGIDTATGDPLLLISRDNRPLSVDGQVLEPVYQEPPPPNLNGRRLSSIELTEDRNIDYDGTRLVASDAKDPRFGSDDVEGPARVLHLWLKRGAPPKTFTVHCGEIRRRTEIRIKEDGRRVPQTVALEEFQLRDPISGGWHLGGLQIQEFGLLFSSLYEVALLPWEELGLSSPLNGEGERSATNVSSDERQVGQAMQLSAEAATLAGRAGSGDAEAMVKLGLAYQTGKLGLPENKLRAMELYQEAALSNVPYAWNNIGQLYLNAGFDMLGGNGNKALPWLEKAAAADIPEAHVGLALLYRFGNRHLNSDEPFVTDRRKALEHAVQAVKLGEEKGSDYALAYGAFHLTELWGDDPPEEREAVRLLEIASSYQGGFSSSAVRLAERYINGQGVPRDLDKALELASQAAGHGHVAGKELVQKIERDLQR